MQFARRIFETTNLPGLFYINYQLLLGAMAGEFMNRVVEDEFVNAFAYEIYTVAPFNPNLQPTKNLHFSPSTPTQGTYREKMENETKKEEKNYKITINPYSLLLCQSTASFNALY